MPALPSIDAIIAIEVFIAHVLTIVTFIVHVLVIEGSIEAITVGPMMCCAGPVQDAPYAPTAHGTSSDAGAVCAAACLCSCSRPSADVASVMVTWAS